MKSRKLWYLIALTMLGLVAVRMTIAQEQAPPPLPDTAGQEQSMSPYDNGQDQGQPPEAASPDQGLTPGGGAQQQGPPPTAARIGVVNGQVSTMRSDTGEWVAAIVNAPLMQGDTIATAGRARTEVQLDFANVMRLSENAQVKIVALWQKHIQIQVGSGTVDFVIFKGAEGDVEIDTPNMAIIPQGEGVYRVQIDGDSQTELSVRKGRAQVSTPQGSTNVDPGCVIYVRGTDNPEYQIANARPLDDWDKWNAERDRAIEQAQSWQYANRYYTGAQDLDQYGTWQNVPDYGQVWSPNVGPDWSPYYDGSWAWEPYWGWTWVSYEPWGWAPYHYGRWFWGGGRWCWWPGIGYWGARPMWAPAYVSFLGLGLAARGIGIGLGIGFGNIGWLALGPFDAIFGWWGHHNGYTAVGIGSIAHIGDYGRLGRMGNGRYMSNLQAALTNANIRRAITTMPAGQFGRGLATRGFGRGVDAATLRNGQMMHGSLPVTPTRVSMRAGGRLASASAIPSRSISSTRFYSRNAGSARGESFTQGAGQNQQMGRQNPASNYGAQPGANSTARYGNTGNAGAYGNNNRAGYGNQRAAGPYSQGQSGNSNWQRFSSRSPYSSPAQGRGGVYNGGSYGSRPGAVQQYGGANRAGGWNAPAPRAQSPAPNWGRSPYGAARPYGGYGSYGGRPTLNMNRPIVVPRSNAPRAYGGGRGSATAKGGKTERSGGGHSGGGEHLGGGGHGGGGHSGGGGGHHR